MYQGKDRHPYFCHLSAFSEQFVGLKVVFYPLHSVKQIFPADVYSNCESEMGTNWKDDLVDISQKEYDASDKTTRWSILFYECLVERKRYNCTIDNRIEYQQYNSEKHNC